MKQELQNYQPSAPVFVLDDEVREEFPLELDFKSVDGLQTKRDMMNYIGKKFTAIFPETEYVTRKMDDFEKATIRGEYCQLVEDLLPERKRQLQEALEESKRIKKEAEESYAAALQEVASMAAEVKHGMVETKLKRADTFTIALAGYYLTYTWNEATETFVLAKGVQIPDDSDVWSSDENNRQQMLELFGCEFPPTRAQKGFDI